MIPGTAENPQRILTIDEIRDVMKKVQDMQLTHEIAFNPDFRLQVTDQTESSLDKTIKAIKHGSFWDNLSEQINSNPPIYGHAIALLGGIKEVSNSKPYESETN